MVNPQYIIIIFVAVLAIIPFLFEKRDIEIPTRTKIIRGIVIVIVIVQAILSSVVYYKEEKRSTELAQKVDQVQTEMASFEKQANMFEMIKRINTSITIDHDQLRRKYPDGYYLYAINKYNIVPAGPNVKIRMNWETSETYISDDGEVLYLVIDQFYYIPQDVTFNKLRVLIEKKTGTIADGIFFDKTGLFVEILDIENDDLIVVFGLKEVTVLPEDTVLKPKMEEYRNRVTGMKVHYMNIGTTKGHTIENFTIVSGWLPRD